MDKLTINQELFNKAKACIPGGVNSPVRAFTNLDVAPIFIKKALGAYLFDHSDNAYLDYICAWGAMILGHGHAGIVTAMKQQLELGINYGTPCALEAQLAELVIKFMPS